MRFIGWLCLLLLLEGSALYFGSKYTTFGHNLLYGNPNTRQWSCMGQCPPEVLKIEVDEDARHARENAGK